MLRKMIAAAAMLLASASLNAASAEDIVLASANPMTGNSAQFGQYKVRAIQLAIEQANAAGGIDGRQVRLVVQDDQGNPKEAALVAQRIVSDDSVMAVIGHWNSSSTLAALPIYDKANIPVVTDSINRKISGASRWSFRVEPTDLQQAEQLSGYIVDTLGYKKIAVIYANNDYGQGLATAFTDALSKRGIQLAAQDAYLEGATDFTPQISNVQQAEPEILFIIGYYREGALIVQQAQRLGLELPILGSDGFTTQELIKLGGAAVEGVIFPGFFFPNDERFPGSLEFVTAYEAKYGEKPESYGALAYDTTNMIFAAMREKGVSREGIRDYLEQMDGFSGVTGSHKFNADHDTEVRIILLTVKDGEIVLAEKQL